MNSSNIIHNGLSKLGISLQCWNGVQLNTYSLAFNSYSNIYSYNIQTRVAVISGVARILVEEGTPTLADIEVDWRGTCRPVQKHFFKAA